MFTTLNPRGCFRRVFVCVDRVGHVITAHVVKVSSWPVRPGQRSTLRKINSKPMKCPLLQIADQCACGLIYRQTSLVHTLDSDDPSDWLQPVSVYIGW